jgi:hypothetical protein
LVAAHLSDVQVQLSRSPDDLLDKGVGWVEVDHRIEPRIRAHVLLCWLALLLIRVAERRAGPTWRRIAIELGPSVSTPSP